jgi:Cys-tRNA(Pro)/Cys-tRNA(Cys) deacylase
MELKEIEEKLLKYSIDYEIIYHTVAIKSKQDAIGLFNIEETAPTLILKTELGFYALIISGEREKIDFKSLKGLLGCKKVEMAKKEEIFEKFGVEAGQVPMIGLDLPCIIDKTLLKYNHIYGGTGNWNYTLKISPDDLITANNVILQID